MVHLLPSKQEVAFNLSRKYCGMAVGIGKGLSQIKYEKLQEFWYHVSSQAVPSKKRHFCLWKRGGDFYQFSFPTTDPIYDPVLFLKAY